MNVKYENPRSFCWDQKWDQQTDDQGQPALLQAESDTLFSIDYDKKQRQSPQGKPNAESNARMFLIKQFLEDT